MASYEMMRVVALYFATLMLIMSFVKGDPQVPCFFIFGDSLSDNGNNNNFQFTLSKADFPPYGIDFRSGVTGRFTNGRTTVDYIAKLLGFDDFIPPFATAAGQDTILKGVNYASGGAGIRQETGRNLWDVLTMDEQLKNHKLTVSRITNYLVTPARAKEHLNKCIYYSSIGNNDYLNNYFMPNFYTTSREFTPEEYAQVLIDQYRDQIETLYNLNARKIVLVGNGQLGSTPYAISKFGKNGSPSIDDVNKASQLFNDKIVALVDQLNIKYSSDSNFIYINTTSIGSEDLIAAAGFTVLDKPCCQVNVFGQCCALTNPCTNRDTYVFYDNFHPTSAVNNYLATRSYRAHRPTDTYPNDINGLAQL